MLCYWYNTRWTHFITLIELKMYILQKSICTGSDKISLIFGDTFFKNMSVLKLLSRNSKLHLVPQIFLIFCKHIYLWPDRIDIYG